MKTERLQVLCGQKVYHVNVHASAKSAESLTKKLPQCTVKRVFNVGKECFVMLETFALRLHFGMAGSLEIGVRTGIALSHYCK